LESEAKAREKKTMAELTINKEYAAKYQRTKERQELEKLKQKYGNVDASNDESSTSESEDEDAEAITPQLERDFLRTLALIKKKDPKIYEKDAKFYEEEDDNETESTTKVKKKPIYLKDYERQRLLERGLKALVSDSESDTESNENDSKENGLTYVKEQKMLKDSFKNVMDGEDSGDDGELLIPRARTASEKEKEEAEYQEWLKSNENVQQIESLDEEEKFLRDYILKKEYFDHDDDDDGIPSYNEIVDEESDDELEREEEFERKFNFRYEEPDQEFIRRFPRTIKESVRRSDDKRKSKRKIREERKKKEKEARKEEIKKMKNLKRKEIMEKIEKLKEMTGNSKVGFLEDDLDGDFDAKKFDKLMNDIYDDEYYETTEHKKPVFDAEEDYEDWDDWTGENEDFEADDAALHCEDPGFNMDADYIPQQKQSKRASKFAEALSKNKPVFNPDEKTFEEYFDEYYKLDYEDIIGDLPVRFKYREVMPNNFGLSTEEILKAQDRELNQWCSLAKAAKYYTKEEEIRERQKYKRKARSALRKKRVFSSVYITRDNADHLEETQAEVNKKEKLEKTKKGSGTADRTKIAKLKSRNQSLRHRNKSHNIRKNIPPKGLSKFRQFGKFKTISNERLAAYGLGLKRKKIRK